MHDLIQPEWVWKVRGDPNIIQSPNTRNVRNKELPSLVNEMAHEDTSSSQKQLEEIKRYPNCMRD